MTKSIDSAEGASDAPRSQTSSALVRLKSELLVGVRAPGDKLKINEIAQEFQISPGAVREALSRLVPEGLVLFRDQKGFAVAPLSLGDLDDLTQVRCDIEEIALRHSVERGDAEWEAQVLATAHRLRRTPRKDSADKANQSWLALHETFHGALVAACGNQRLLAIRAQLHQQSERYRILSALVDDDRDVDAEHQALVDFALDRDADSLVRNAKAHFQTTTRLIKAAVERSDVADSKLAMSA